jgi:AMMECR1 domain-containing protein
VTLYNKGEVCGSAGNIKEIEENLLNELIASTVAALSTDKRFEPILSVEEAETLKVRIDEIVSKIVLVEEKELLKLEPKKVGTIVIKKDYEKMAVILPNISSNLHYGKDFPEALSNKLGEKFKFSDYIVYKLETKQYTNF